MFRCRVRLGLILLAIFSTLSLAYYASFHAYADSLDGPAFRVYLSGQSGYQSIFIDRYNDSVERTLITLDANISSFQIANMGSMQGSVVTYSILLCPVVNGAPASQFTFTRYSGQVVPSYILYAQNATIHITNAPRIFIEGDNLDHNTCYQYAQIVTVQFQLPTYGGQDQARFYFTGFPLFTQTSGPNTWDGTCAVLDCSITFNNSWILSKTFEMLDDRLLWINDDLNNNHTELLTRLPTASGYSYTTISRDSNGNLVTSQSSGTWWKATLETLKNLSFDIDKSVQYQNLIDQGSTNETGSALEDFLGQLNQENAYGLISSLDVSAISGDTDISALGTVLIDDLPVWWTQQVKDLIDAVPSSRIIDDEVWVLPYNEAKEELDEVLGLGGGD